MDAETDIPETIIRCERFLTGSYKRNDASWPVFDLQEMIESNLFLQAAAE